MTRQFHPRIGALAAVSMNKRQHDAHNPLQEPLLLSQSVPATAGPQVSAVAGQRLLSAMDMLKPILAESPEKASIHSRPVNTRGQMSSGRSNPSHSRHNSGGANSIV